MSLSLKYELGWIERLAGVPYSQQARPENRPGRKGLMVDPIPLLVGAGLMLLLRDLGVATLQSPVAIGHERGAA